MRASNDIEGMIDVLRTHWPGDPADVVIKACSVDGAQRVPGRLPPPADQNRLPPQEGAMPAHPSSPRRCRAWTGRQTGGAVCADSRVVRAPVRGGVAAFLDRPQAASS
jgi:hypothetical protein